MTSCFQRFACFVAKSLAKWGHISEAKVIVEMALKDFNIESSQGTHFFQNVTSLGVGYLSINPSAGDGVFAQEKLDAMPLDFDGEWFKIVKFLD